MVRDDIALVDIGKLSINRSAEWFYTRYRSALIEGGYKAIYLYNVHVKLKEGAWTLEP